MGTIEDNESIRSAEEHLAAAEGFNMLCNRDYEGRLRAHRILSEQGD